MEPMNMLLTSDFVRERSDSRGSGSRSRDNPYEPMYYADSPIRHHPRRQHSEVYG